MKSRNSGLRTVDVARQGGYSVQQVRNLERDGVLPPARRTTTVYRTYTDAHVQSAQAYRAPQQHDIVHGLDAAGLRRSITGFLDEEGNSPRMTSGARRRSRPPAGGLADTSSTQQKA